MALSWHCRRGWCHSRTSGNPPLGSLAAVSKALFTVYFHLSLLLLIPRKCQSLFMSVKEEEIKRKEKSSLVGPEPLWDEKVFSLATWRLEQVLCLYLCRLFKAAEPVCLKEANTAVANDTLALCPSTHYSAQVDLSLRRHAWNRVWNGFAKGTCSSILSSFFDLFFVRVLVWYNLIIFLILFILCACFGLI